MYELLVQEFILKYICCCSVAKLCLTRCDRIDCSTPGLPVLHYHSKFAQTHVHCVSDAIQPSHPLLPSSPPAPNLSQHQGLIQCVGSSHQVAKVLELQFQHQSFQWIFRVDFLLDWLVWWVFLSITIQKHQLKYIFPCNLIIYILSGFTEDSGILKT